MAHNVTGNMFQDDHACYDYIDIKAFEYIYSSIKYHMCVVACVSDKLYAMHLSNDS